MAKTSSIAREAKAMAREGRRVAVSWYDRVASMMLALLISIGVVASLLFFIWLSGRIHVSTVSVPVQMAEYREDGEGGGDGRPTGGSQLDAPSDDPFVASGESEQPADVEQDLSTLGAAVSSSVAELDDPSLAAPAHRGSYGAGGGIYGGFGDGRGLGHGPGKPGLPRHWEVTFQKGSTLDLYAKQLDYFGIELGVVMPDNRVVYAFNLKKPKPDKKEIRDPAKNETRYYLTWRSGALEAADEELLKRAGIDCEGRQIFKFLSQETEQKLAALERDFRGASPKDISKTRFGVQTVGDGFVFYVIEQPMKR
ncbi:MAG: hypothetical protein ABFC63_09120 [Thermoguttaceae bacterium]